MSNPVEKIQALKSQGDNDFAFPSSLGGNNEEKHFNKPL